MLLDVKATIAESFERMHRPNLIGMGLVPLQFLDGENALSLGLDGTEHRYRGTNGRYSNGDCKCLHRKR